jgi:hypothetical protein
MEMLAAGADPVEVARTAGVALRTVHRWIADARASSAAAAGTALAPPASARPHILSASVVVLEASHLAPLAEHCCDKHRIAR